MGQQSVPIQQRYLARQSVEPQNPIDGFIWINPSGGANGNNTERYNWNQDASAWELDNSVGPDTPQYPATGAMWRDTSNGNTKSYDGSQWVNVGVNNHTNLNGVATGQHGRSIGHPDRNQNTRSSSANVLYPDNLWDGTTSGSTHFEQTGETVTYEFPYPVYVGEFRHYGYYQQNGDGEFTIEVRRHGSWTTVATISTRIDTWSSWVSLDTYGDAIRFAATTADSGTNYAASVGEIQFG